MSNPFMRSGTPSTLAEDLRRIGIKPESVGISSVRRTAAPGGRPSFRHTTGSAAISRIEEAAQNLTIYGRGRALRPAAAAPARRRPVSRTENVLESLQNLRRGLMTEAGDKYHDGQHDSMRQDLRQPVGDQMTQVTSELLDTFRHAGSITDVLAARIESLIPNRARNRALQEEMADVVAHLRNMKGEIANGIRVLEQFATPEPPKRPGGAPIPPAAMGQEDEKSFKEALEAFVRDLIEATEYLMQLRGTPANA